MRGEWLKHSIPCQRVRTIGCAFGSVLNRRVAPSETCSSTLLRRRIGPVTYRPAGTTTRPPVTWQARIARSIAEVQSAPGYAPKSLIRWSVIRRKLEVSDAESIGQWDSNHPGRVPGVDVTSALPVGLEDRLALFAGDLEVPVAGLGGDALRDGFQGGFYGGDVLGAVHASTEGEELVSREEGVQVMVLHADRGPADGVEPGGAKGRVVVLFRGPHVHPGQEPVGGDLAPGGVQRVAGQAEELVGRHEVVHAGFFVLAGGVESGACERSVEGSRMLVVVAGQPDRCFGQQGLVVQDDGSFEGGQHAGDAGGGDGRGGGRLGRGGGRLGRGGPRSGCHGGGGGVEAGARGGGGRGVW